MLDVVFYNLLQSISNVETFRILLQGLCTFLELLSQNLLKFLRVCLTFRFQARIRLWRAAFIFKLLFFEFGTYLCFLSLKLCLFGDWLQLFFLLVRLDSANCIVIRWDSTKLEIITTIDFVYQFLVVPKLFIFGKFFSFVIIVFFILFLIAVRIVDRWFCQVQCWNWLTAVILLIILEFVSEYLSLNFWPWFGNFPQVVHAVVDVAHFTVNVIKHWLLLIWHARSLGAVLGTLLVRLQFCKHSKFLLYAVLNLLFPTKCREVAYEAWVAFFSKHVSPRLIRTMRFLWYCAADSILRIEVNCAIDLE